MGSTDSDLVRKAEAILASAKSFKGDRAERYEVMKQVDLLYQELEDPMDAMLKQWTSVSNQNWGQVMELLFVSQSLIMEWHPC